MKVVALKAGPYPDITLERRNGQLRVIQKAVAHEKEDRPDDHQHDGENQPILTFDLHGTLTPDPGYPLTSPAYDGVKAFMDKMAARGCCIHLASGSLKPSADEVFTARLDQAQSFANKNGLPISWFGPKVGADAYIDDRMFNIPANPDWGAIGDAAEKMLALRFSLDDSNTYQKIDPTPIGDTVKPPDSKDVGNDRPRGFTSPIIDIDFHGTINPALGKDRQADPTPECIAAINGLYDQGYTIHVSDASWNPATQGGKDSDAYLAAIQQYLGCYGIRYDLVVAKDSFDLTFDDLGAAFNGNWASTVKAALKIAKNPPPSTTMPGAK